MVEPQSTLKQLVAYNVTYHSFNIEYIDSLYAYSPSLSDFGDAYTCNVCVDTHVCLICTEIEVVLQIDIFYEISTNTLDVPDVNVVSAAKILSSIEQTHALELNLLLMFLQFNEKISLIISSKLDSQQE